MDQAPSATASKRRRPRSSLGAAAVATITTCALIASASFPSAVHAGLRGPHQLLELEVTNNKARLPQHGGQRPRRPTNLPEHMLPPPGFNDGRRRGLLIEIENGDESHSHSRRLPANEAMGSRGRGRGDRDKDRGDQKRGDNDNKRDDRNDGKKRENSNNSNRPKRKPSRLNNGPSSKSQKDKDRGGGGGGGGSSKSSKASNRQSTSSSSKSRKKQKQKGKDKDDDDKKNKRDRLKQKVQALKAQLKNDKLTKEEKNEMKQQMKEMMAAGKDANEVNEQLQDQLDKQTEEMEVMQMQLLMGGGEDGKGGGSGGKDKGKGKDNDKDKDKNNAKGKGKDKDKGKGKDNEKAKQDKAKQKAKRDKLKQKLQNLKDDLDIINLSKHEKNEIKKQMNALNAQVKEMDVMLNGMMKDDNGQQQGGVIKGEKESIDANVNVIVEMEDKSQPTAMGGGGGGGGNVKPKPKPAVVVVRPQEETKPNKPKPSPANNNNSLPKPNPPKPAPVQVDNTKPSKNDGNPNPAPKPNEPVVLSNNKPKQSTPPNPAPKPKPQPVVDLSDADILSNYFDNKQPTTSAGGGGGGVADMTSLSTSAGTNGLLNTGQWKFVPTLTDTSRQLTGFEEFNTLDWIIQPIDPWVQSPMHSYEGSRSMRSGISSSIYNDDSVAAVESRLTLSTDRNFEGGVLTFQILATSLKLPSEAFYVTVDDEVELPPDITAKNVNADDNPDWVELSVPVRGGKHVVTWIHVYNPFGLTSLPPLEDGTDVNDVGLWMDDLQYVPFTTASSVHELEMTNGNDSGHSHAWQIADNGDRVVAYTSDIDDKSGSTDIQFALNSAKGGVLKYRIQSSTTAPHDDFAVLFNGMPADAIFGEMLGYDMRTVEVPKGKQMVTLRHRKNPGDLGRQVLNSLGPVGTNGMTWLEELTFDAH